MWALKKLCVALTIFGLVWGLFGALPASGESINAILPIEILVTPESVTSNAVNNETLIGLFTAVWIAFVRVAGRNR